jgi:hypothetical protein
LPVILVDANIEGQCARIWQRLQSDAWRELTTALDVTFRTFCVVGLDPASPDDRVWHFCQDHGHYLLTNNRNEDTEDSLEATIRRDGASSSLPIFTIASADRVYRSPTILDRVVEKLLDYILYADSIRGAGRLYLP